MIDVHELMDRLQDGTDGENAELGIYDEDGTLYEVTDVDAQGGNGAPVAIHIRKSTLA